MKKVCFIVTLCLFCLVLLVCSCHQHSAMAVDEILPTCTENGRTAGEICSECGEILSGCETLLATGHKINTVAEVKATCTETGCTEGQVCSTCGFVLTGCKEISAMGHDWELSEVVHQTACDKGRFSCQNCKETRVHSFSYEYLGIPVLSLQGSLDGVSKTQKVGLVATYDGGDVTFECDIQLRVQGSSSAGYPKKNFNAWLYQTDTDKKFKVELGDGWGKENKYCLKANYIDFSQARNVVSAKIWGDIAHTYTLGCPLDTLVNSGSVDGFPVLLCLNGSVYGLYTLNIPKDNWQFGLSNGEGKTAVLFGSQWSDSVALKTEMNADITSSSWELEFCSTEDTELGTAWVVDSFNTFIRFINQSSDEEFKQNIGKYTDLVRVIDNMLYTELSCAVDNRSKNILWVTYDGTKWYPTPYDMDDSWGLVWNGLSYYASTQPIETFMTNALWVRICELLPDRVAQRYAELRSSFLTPDYVIEQFEDFIGQIPTALYNIDASLWTEIPSVKTNNLTQIKYWTTARFKFLDKYYQYKAS